MQAAARSNASDSRYLSFSLLHPTIFSNGVRGGHDHRHRLGYLGVVAEGGMGDPILLLPDANEDP